MPFSPPTVSALIAVAGATYRYNPVVKADLPYALETPILIGAGALIMEVEREDEEIGAVAEVLAWLEREGIHGVGQSSWGPTGFGVIGTEAAGQSLLESAMRRWPASSCLAFELRRGRNLGAEIEVSKAIRLAP